MSEIWIATITILAVQGSALAFVYNVLAKRLDRIEVRLDRIDARLDQLIEVLREHGERLTALEHR